MTLVEFHISQGMELLAAKLASGLLPVASSAWFPVAFIVAANRVGTPSTVRNSSRASFAIHEEDGVWD